MPVYLRNFYYKQLADFKNKESDEIKKAQDKQKSRINRPSFKR